MSPTSSFHPRERSYYHSKRLLMGSAGIFFLLMLVGVGLGSSTSLPVHAQTAQTSHSAQAQQSALPTLSHTSPTVDATCSQSYYSRDGNPFQLCPGPYPSGGNCVWWAWEQWHLLGYDLPLNWGNAADWVVDAERTGLLVGTQPRVGSLAVFPRGDGVWAYGSAGHVAFVTSVSADDNTFNVTYQNYGDPKPLYVGVGYNVSLINEPRYQNGEMRFIYFPRDINASLFARLATITSNDLAGIATANGALANSVSSSSDGSSSTSAGITVAGSTAAVNTSTTVGSSRPTLGLPSGSGSADQEFNADFTGNGLSDLLLYNRPQGSLSVLSLVQQNSLSTLPSRYAYNQASEHPNAPKMTRLVPLSDAKTSVNGWGSSLDIRIGDFAGTGKSDILLYNRTNGTMQILTLTTQLTIQQHVTLNGWGPNWELYTGRFDEQRTGVFMYNRFADASIPTSLASATRTGGLTLDQWYMTGRTANVVILDFNSDLSVRHLQEYKQWHNSWEVYIGQFKNINQDGVFLYDRSMGELRIMDFSSDMSINDYHEYHGFAGNWQVFSGDFNGSGRSQVMLYEPSKGQGEFLVFGPDLSLVTQHNYTGWAKNEVFYVGHFGTTRLDAMLYDPQAGTSTFIVFNDALKITHLYTVHSWDQHWQILIGSFVDRLACAGNNTCSKGDDILVLNRATGQIQQFVFTFGRQYKIIDTRVQALARAGANGASKSTGTPFRTVDTTTFKALATFDTTIGKEELY